MERELLLNSPMSRRPPCLARSDDDRHKAPTILLVDDEDGIRQLLCDALVAAGYDVLQASDGAEALRLATDHRGEIDVLVTDVIMPHLNGLELARQLSAKRPEVKVVFISGHIEAQILLGADPGLVILRKPFRTEFLLMKVSEAIRF